MGCSTRLYMARVCVEIDLLKHKIEEFWIDIGEEKRLQKVIFEKHPNYCVDCLHLGHSADDCYANGKKPTPMWRSDNMEIIVDNEDLRAVLNQKRSAGKGKEISGDLKESNLDGINNKEVANMVWIQKRGSSNNLEMATKVDGVDEVVFNFFVHWRKWSIVPYKKNYF
ncbi:uncharacterized protein LOC122017127 [Zingiber officinale]|uniref:uncharacterized protein LOC122017127 n=1 Tax=Zingiber officinale TaxID=94328 RepID=UPI001C4D1E42|nr:uncharacterized protein LOC122017127 [Zingiber officinale]